MAEVDGRGITQMEWDAAHQRNIERLRQQMPTVDMKLLDSPAVRAETLDSIVRERVLLAAAEHMHLGVSDQRLQRVFATDPQFAPLRNPDGSVNRDLLMAQGMSSEMFAQSLRQDLAMRQVMQGIGGTVVAPKAVVDPSLDALLQRRQVQFQRFDAQAFRSKVNPSDAEIEAFYKANEALFRAPEQARIEYVLLDLQALQKGVTVSDDELQRFYTENASRYTAAEERRASHILIKADKDMAAADRQKARAKADALLDQLRKSPGQFAELARKNSDDPGSAERGGDLDFFGRGAMVKPFDDAVFAMKHGEISNVVESEFGFHIIQLTGQRGGEKKSFDAVRAEIEAEVKRQLAQKRFAEAAEQFTNTVYEQSDSLQPVIDKLKLEKRSALVQRTPAPGATGALASAKLLEAVFGNDAINNKRNTDAIEVGPSQLAVGAHRRTPAGAHAAAGRGQGPGARAPGGRAGRGAGAQGRPGAAGAAAEGRRPRIARQRGHRPVQRADRAAQRDRRRARRRRQQAAGAAGRGPGRAGLLGGQGHAGAAARPRAGSRADAAGAVLAGHRHGRDAGLLRRAEDALQGRDQAGRGRIGRARHRHASYNSLLRRWL